MVSFTWNGPKWVCLVTKYKGRSSIDCVVFDSISSFARPEPARPLYTIHSMRTHMLQDEAAIENPHGNARYGKGRKFRGGDIVSSCPRSTVLDFVLLSVIFFSYVFLLPEAPHGDGVRWAESIEAHHIEVNPNYLLMEPIAVAAYSAWEALGLPHNGTQFQKYCDVFVAILTLFLLNVCLQLIAVPDILRRLSIVFMAFSYNFFYLATSDHIKLITAPFLLLTILYVFLYFRSRRLTALIWAGFFMGLSICTLVNAAAWFGLLVPLLFVMEGPTLLNRIRVAGLFGFSATVPALVVFVTSYLLSSREKPFLSWLTSYGSNVATQEVGFGGLNPLTIGRAISAIIKNFVFSGDLGPVVKALVLGTSLPQISGAVLLLNAVAFLAISWMLLQVAWWAVSSWRRLTKLEIEIGLTMVTAVLGYFVFGLVWNSSEEEFWFQITAPIVIMVAMFMKSHLSKSLRMAAMAVAMALVILNTLISFALPRHAYPYLKYVDELFAVLGTTNLLIYDGSEPVNGLVYGIKLKASPHAIGISSFLDKHGYDLHKTLASLDREIQKTKAAGGNVYVLDILSPQSTSHPWTLLRERFGIQKADVVSFLRSLGTYRTIQLVGQPAWVLE